MPLSVPLGNPPPLRVALPACPAALLSSRPGFGDHARRRKHGTIGEAEEAPSEGIRSIIRESVTTSGAGRSRQEEEEPQAESTAPEQSHAGDEELPIEDYDSLNIKQISERLEGLSDEEVERLRRYEAANKTRSTLLRRLDERL